MTDATTTPPTGTTRRALGRCRPSRHPNCRRAASPDREDGSARTACSRSRNAPRSRSAASVRKYAPFSCTTEPIRSPVPTSCIDHSRSVTKRICATPIHPVLPDQVATARVQKWNIRTAPSHRCTKTFEYDTLTSNRRRGAAAPACPVPEISAENYAPTRARADEFRYSYWHG